MAKIEEITLEQLTPDNLNFNKGTEYGGHLMEKSLRDFGLGRSILLDKDNRIIAGNKTTETAAALGFQKVLVVDTEGDTLVAVRRTDIDLDSPQGRELALADNATSKANLAWDEEAILKAAETFNIEPEDWGIDIEALSAENDVMERDPENRTGALSARFILPPMSVLNTRSGDWVKRANEWKSIGLDSQKGRESELTYSVTAQPPAYYEAKNTLRKKIGREPTTEEVVGFCEENGITLQSSTSIFDPTLCELLYYWFNLPKGRIIDPFSGGSVRGIIAGVMDMPYIGNDIRPEQIKANEKNLDEVSARVSIKTSPIWTVGDSVFIDEIVKKADVDDKFDLVFSCPPYADLEVYSDDPKDLSNMPYEQFLEAYRTIISKCISMLKEDRFAVFVVGEVRDKKGIYRNFVSDTIMAFQDAGANYYNEIILINQLSSLAIRAGRTFTASRKVGKCHQNVLVFYKGNPKNIKRLYGEVMPRDYFDEVLKEENSDE